MSTGPLAVKSQIITHPDGFSVTVARSLGEVEQYRKVWEMMTPILDIQFDIYLNRVKNRSEVISPHLLILERNGQPEMVLIGVVEQLRFGSKFHYPLLINPSIRFLTVLGWGVSGDNSKHGCQVFISELIKTLNRGDADIAFFRDVPSDSDILGVGTKIPRSVWRDFSPRKDIQYRLALPQTIDDFYKSKKRKKNLLRIQRRLEREFPGNVIFRKFQNGGDVEKLLEDAAYISRKTYQYALNRGIAEDDEKRSLLSLLAEKGFLFSFVLYLDDKPSVFYIGYIHNHTLYLDYTGYDPHYAKHEVGTILLLRIIEESILDDAIRYIDFGTGDTFQKRRLGNHNWEVSSFFLFQESFRGFFLNSGRIINFIISELARWTIKALRLSDLYIKYKSFRRKKEEKEISAG